MKLVSIFFFFVFFLGQSFSGEKTTSSAQLNDDSSLVSFSNVNRDRIQDLLDNVLLKGHEGGNGGDPIRMSFLDTAASIVRKYPEEIIKIIGEDKFAELIGKISIEYIKTSSYPLIDNTRSPVSALLNEQGELTLYIGKGLGIGIDDLYPNLSWHNILRDKYTREKLVLHELFRLIGINDDNYFNSNKVLYPYGAIEISEKFKIEDPESISKIMSTINPNVIDVETEECLETKTFRGDLFVELNCLEDQFRCQAIEIEGQEAALNFGLIRSQHNENFMASANRLNVKGYISCLYQERNNTCSNQQQKSNYNCNISFLDRIDTQGNFGLQNPNNRGIETFFYDLKTGR